MESDRDCSRQQTQQNGGHDQALSLPIQAK